MSDRYENTQQKISRLEGIVGSCRENYMNDEAYISKLEGLASKPAPEPKRSGTSFFGSKKK